MKKFTVFIIVLLFFISFSAYSVDEEAKNIFETALSYMKGRQPEKAIEMFRLILDEHNDTEFARQSIFYLGEIKEEQANSNISDALSYYSRTMLLYTGTDIARKAMEKSAGIYRKYNMQEELIDILYRIIKTFPEELETEKNYFEFVRLSDDSEQKEDVMMRYFENFTYSPRVSEMYNELFTLRAEQKKWEECDDIYDRIDKEEIRGELLTDFYINTGRYDMIGSIDEDSPYYLSVLYTKGDIAGIEEYYDNIIEGTDDMSKFIKAVDYLRAEGERDIALEKITEKLGNIEQSSPYYQSLLWRLGRIYEDKNHFVPDETGTKYFKKTDMYNKAKEYYENILSDNHSPYRKKALYRIISIEKDHLYDWDNLKDKAEILMDDYPYSEEAEKAEELLEKYNL